jgi:hypothetical protein
VGVSVSLALASSRHSPTHSQAAQAALQQRRRAASDSSKYRFRSVLDSCTCAVAHSAGSAGAALLFWAVGCGQGPSSGVEGFAVLLDWRVLQAAQGEGGGGVSEPDFCRRVDTSLLPRSRSVPQAIWPRARKLAIGGKRREATLPCCCCCCCCCLLNRSLLCSAPLHSPCGLLTAAQRSATAPEPRATNHTAPEELPAGTGPVRAPNRPSDTEAKQLKGSCLQVSLLAAPKLDPLPRAGVAPFLCKPPVLRTDRTAPHRACNSLTSD